MPMKMLNKFTIICCGTLFTFLATRLRGVMKENNLIWLPEKNLRKKKNHKRKKNVEREVDKIPLVEIVYFLFFHLSNTLADLQDLVL